MIFQVAFKKKKLYPFDWYLLYPRIWDSVIQSQRGPSWADLCDPLTPPLPCVLGCRCSTTPRNSNVLARPLQSNSLALHNSALSRLHHLPWSSSSPGRKDWPCPSLGSHSNPLFLFKSLQDYRIDLFTSVSASLPRKSVLLTSYLLLLAQWQIAFQKCVYQFNLPSLGHEKAGIIF